MTNLKATVSRLEGELAATRIAEGEAMLVLDSTETAYKRLEQDNARLRAALEHIEKMPWPNSESPYALIARAALNPPTTEAHDEEEKDA